MISALLMVVLVSLPANAQAVRIGADAWPARVDIAKIEALGAGDRVWWWSADCAPSQLMAGAQSTDCRAATRRTVSVVDDRGKAVPGALVVWGTEEMLAEMPETMLPAVTLGENGSAPAFFPATTPIYARAAGPKAASWWQRIAAASTPIAIRASEATLVRTAIHLSGTSTVSRSIIEIEPVFMTAAPSDIRSWGTAERDAVMFLPLPKLAVRYTAWSDDAAPQSGVATTAAFPRSLTLPVGARVEGLVHAPRHTVIADAAIEAVFSMPAGSRALRRRARSDAKGHFIMHGLPAGPVQLLVRRAGYATAVRMVRLGAAAADVEEFLLRPARNVMMAVVDRSGRPVPYADMRTGDGAHATADSEGLASLDGVPADEDFLLQVRARGFRNAEVRVPVDVKGKVRAVLSRGVRFRATLQDAETHQPAGPGTVMIANNGGRHIELFDASGVIDVGGLSSGTLSVEIRADGAAPFVIAERAVSDEEEVAVGEVRLSKGASIAGHVVSRQSGAPIVNAHVRLLRRSGFGPTGAFVMRDWAEGSSGDDGSFNISGFEAGPQVLIVEAAGFASRLVTQEVRDSPTPVDVGTIDLDTGRELIVDCTPVSRCGTEARLLFAGEEFSWASIGTALQNGTAHLLPTGSGTVTLRLLAAGHVVDERAVEISPQSDATHIHVKLVSTVVTGTVTSGGQPRKSGQVQLERVSSANHEMPVYLTSQTPEGQQASSSWLTDLPEVQITAIDESGRFKFEDVQPGTYTATYRLNGTGAASVRIAVPESERYDFPIELPPGELHGRVTDERSQPVGLAIVEIRDADGELHSARSDEAGEFSATGLPTGKVLVRAINRDGEGNAEVDVNPPRVAVADVLLRKKDKAPVSVTVTDPSGQPLSGAVVFLLGSSALPSAVATTDVSGIATLRLSQPLMTPVAVYHGAYGWSWLSPRVLGSSENSECTVRMVVGTGCVVVASNTATTVDLFAPSGISLGGAFSFLGLPVSVTPGRDLRLSGLPPGAYTLRSGIFQTAAEVQSGRDARVTIR